MSLTTDLRHTLTIANGVTTAFAFGVKFLADTDLQVYVDNVLKTIITDYTVSGAGNETGGTVTFLVAPLNLEEVLILRKTPYAQTTDLIANAEFKSQVLEDTFDRLLMIMRDNHPRGIPNAGDPNGVVVGYADTRDTIYDTVGFQSYVKATGLGTDTGWDTI